MALIKCSKCGKDYSNLLSVCKYCNNKNDLRWENDLIDDTPKLKNKSFIDDIKKFKVLIIIGVASWIYLFTLDLSVETDTNYSQCECVGFFKTHINSLYDKNSDRTSEILECIETYVYNEKEGIKNINPCFDKAWKNVKQGAAFDRSSDVGFNYAAEAMYCNCN